MKKDSKQRLFEMMGKIDPTFKPNAKLLTEWNFDKKKGDVDKEEDKKEDKDEKKDGKKKFNFEKKEDKELVEVIKRVAPNFKAKTLNEGGWNLPDDVRGDDPHFEGEPEPDEFDHWEIDITKNGNPELNLYSEHDGKHNIDWENVFGAGNDAEFEAAHEQLKDIEDYPELKAKIDAYVQKYLQDNLYGNNNIYKSNDKFWEYKNYSDY